MPTIRYWMETEVHVYAFSIAANVLLSFFPFLIVMVSLCHNVLEWRAAEEAIYLALSDYFPSPIGDFVQRNLRASVNQHPLQLFSILLLFFTANGIFEPLEVALNRAWGITKNRNFFRNQVVSMGLILICGALILFSTLLTAINAETINQETASNPELRRFAMLLFFKAAAVPMSILIIFLIYWILPNEKLNAAYLIAPSILVGLALEGLKYINLLTWPWLRVKLQAEYGPFTYSVTIILWSFFASLILLAGAEWAARQGKIRTAPATS
jgi:membrane protein